MAKSIPTITGTFELGGKITIKTNRDSTNNKHALYYSWGSAYNDVFIADGITDSYTWTIPKTLANNIPRGTAGVLYLKLTTNDTLLNTYVGASTISKTISVPNTDEFKPNITDIELSEVGNVAANLGIWVEKQSKIKGLVKCTQAYGSPTESVKIEANNTIFTELNFNFTTGFLSVKGEHVIKATVTDARGRSKTFEKKINVLPYENPYITSANVVRASSTTAKLTLVGGITALNNTNSKSYYYKYKKKEDDYYGNAIAISNDAYTINKTITISGLEDTQYDFLVGIQDAYKATEKGEVYLPSTSKVFNVSKDKKKFAFFGKAVKDGVQFFSRIFDRYGVEMRNGVALWDNGTTDANTTLEELIVTTYNTPTNNIWYVRTIFSNGRTTGTARMQVAYPYNQDTTYKLYFRYYDNSKWSSWVAFGGNANDDGILKIGNNICIQYGSLSARVDTGNTAKQISFNFNTPFSRCYDMIPFLETSAVTGCQVGRGTIAASSASIWFNRTNTSATIVHWIAIGKLE